MVCNCEFSLNQKKCVVFHRKCTMILNLFRQNLCLSFVNNYCCQYLVDTCYSSYFINIFFKRYIIYFSRYCDIIIIIIIMNSFGHIVGLFLTISLSHNPLLRISWGQQGFGQYLSHYFFNSFSRLPNDPTGRLNFLPHHWLHSLLYRKWNHHTPWGRSLILWVSSYQS